MGRAVKVRASALTSDLYTSRNIAMMDFNAVTRLAAKTAYEMAGPGPDDVDLIELHDCFATAEIAHFENLGICKDGEAGNRQVSGARIGLTHVVGAGSACAVHILEKA